MVGSNWPTTDLCKITLHGEPDLLLYLHVDSQYLTRLKEVIVVIFSAQMKVSRSKEQLHVLA